MKVHELEKCPVCFKGSCQEIDWVLSDGHGFIHDKCLIKLPINRIRILTPETAMRKFFLGNLALVEPAVTVRFRDRVRSLFEKLTGIRRWKPVKELKYPVSMLAGIDQVHAYELVVASIGYHKNKVSPEQMWAQLPEQTKQDISEFVKKTQTWKPVKLHFVK